MSAFLAIVRQTIALSFRGGGGAPIGLLFFVSVIVMVPFGMGTDPALLARVGPAMLWLSALLATLLGLDRLFQDDRDDGALDQLVMSGMALEAVVLAKAVGHWVATVLPLVLAAPLLGLFLNLPWDTVWIVTLTLLVGSPALTLIGTVGAAIMVAVRRGGIMVAVLVLPFTIPVLIFGVAASLSTVIEPGPFWQPFLFLSALTLLFLVVGPISGAAAIRGAQE